MKDSELLIDTFVRHYAGAQSDNSFSYLVNYYLRNGLSNYQDPFVDLILNAKPPVDRFIRVMNWFYSSAFIPDASNVPFHFLMNSDKLIRGLGNEGIKKAYEETDSYLRKGINLNLIERKLYEILQDSALKEYYDQINNLEQQAKTPIE